MSRLSETDKTMILTRHSVELEKPVVAHAVHVEFVPSSVVVALSGRQHTNAGAKVILAHHFTVLQLDGQEVAAWSSHQHHESVAGKRPE